MTNDPQSQPDSISSRGYLPVLLLLFVGSGCAALIYEIVWFQLLRLAVGSTAVSLGVLLGTFMGGMCLGSVGFPYLVSSRWHPLRVYAVLELGIGAMGLGLLYLLPVAGQFYASHVGHGAAAIALRGVICGLCLLPPTVLMGATLPGIARWMETNRVGVSRLGFFYGANIAGAVFGCLLTGFLLLRVYDVVVATYVAAAVNATVVLIGSGLSLVSKYRAPAPVRPADRGARSPRPLAVYVTIGLSGMCAMGAEVVWTRQLSLLLGATVYTFSIILAVFLIGLGIGSSVGSVMARDLRSPRMLLGWCQLLLVLAIGWTAYMVSDSLPFWPIDASLTTGIDPGLVDEELVAEATELAARGAWHSFQLDLVRCLWAMLPAACLWGASFPLALAAAASRGQDPGRLVGRVYAANTVGAIIGSLAFSILVIGWLGTQVAQQVLIAVSSLAALLMFGPVLWGPAPSGDRRPWSDGVLGWLGHVAILGLAGAALWSVPELPTGLIAYGRQLPTWNPLPEFIYRGEGMNASIAVSKHAYNERHFHVSGKTVASSDRRDMRLQGMLGHLPALIHPKPRSVLVVGCGAGVTAGTFVPYREIEKIVICEIEPLVCEAARDHFWEYNNHVLDDNRTELVFDDARHYILTTEEEFDIITSDPIHPWVKGAASLYSVEYFEYCKEHLAPGGVITQWVPLYESSLEVVQSEIVTFLKVFPNGTIWSNDDNGVGYDIVLLAQVEPTRIDIDQLQYRLEDPNYADVWDSLQSAGFPSAIDLLTTYAGQEPGLRMWLRNAQINEDRNMRLEYLAGMALNHYNDDEIFQKMMFYCWYPESLFVATEEQKAYLRSMIQPYP